METYQVVRILAILFLCAVLKILTVQINSEDFDDSEEKELEHAAKYDPPSERAIFSPGETWTGPIYRVSKPGADLEHYILGSMHTLGRWYTKNIAQAIPEFLEEHDIEVVYTELGQESWCRTYKFEDMLWKSLCHRQIQWKGLETDGFVELGGVYMYVTGGDDTRKEAREHEASIFPKLPWYMSLYHQFDWINPFLPRCKLPEDAFKAYDTWDEYSEDFHRAYKTGRDDVVAINVAQNKWEAAKLCQIGRCPSCDDRRRSRAKIAYRNKHWVGVLNRETEPSFVVCGLAHFYIGKDNFLNLLRADGWEVKKYKGLTIPEEPSDSEGSSVSSGSHDSSRRLDTAMMKRKAQGGS